MNQRGKDAEATSTLLDRLVCDELTPAERSEVLLWLESDQTRWRKCSLVFLEAQLWRKALQTDSLAAPLASPIGAAPTARLTRTSMTCMTIAAAALTAFGFGWGGAVWLQTIDATRGVASSRDRVHPDNEVASEPDAKSEESMPGESRKTQFASFALAGFESKTRTPELKVPLPLGESTTPLPGDVFLSEYEQKKWERRGLRVSKVREYVPGKLPDGKPVLLSVERLRFERVSAPTI